MKVTIVEGGSVINVAEPDSAGVSVVTAKPADVNVIAMEGTPGEQGPQGEPGVGVLTGPLSDRPEPPQVGLVYITTDTNETYVASGTEE